jgi:hypothetical protein
MPIISNLQKYLILTLLFIIAGCGTKTSESTEETNLDSDTRTATTDFEEEEFNEFFETFKEDSLFQITRIEFPFTEKYLDIYEDKMTTEKITKENWKHLKFEYKEEYETRPVDAYRQGIKIYADSANLFLQGIDNGIHVRFTFLKKKGQWLLVSKEDLST